MECLAYRQVHIQQHHLATLRDELIGSVAMQEVRHLLLGQVLWTAADRLVSLGVWVSVAAKRKTGRRVGSVAMRGVKTPPSWSNSVA
jgi:ribosomal protein L19E